MDREVLADAFSLHKNPHTILFFASLCSAILSEKQQCISLIEGLPIDYSKQIAMSMMNILFI